MLKKLGEATFILLSYKSHIIAQIDANTVVFHSYFQFKVQLLNLLTA